MGIYSLAKICRVAENGLVGLMASAVPCQLRLAHLRRPNIYCGFMSPFSCLLAVVIGRLANWVEGRVGDFAN